MTQPTTETSQDALVLTRTFDAPRDLVFKAWTEAERLAKWWGPKGADLRVAKLEVKPGGLFLYALAMPDGLEMWGRFVFKEIVAPERLVFATAFSNAEGGIVPNPFGMPEWPAEILNTLTFTEADGKTTLTMRGEPLGATLAQIEAFRNLRGSMQQGFAGTFDQLDDYLARA